MIININKISRFTKIITIKILGKVNILKKMKFLMIKKLKIQ